MKVLFLGITQFKDAHSKYVKSIELFKPIPDYLKLLRILWFKFNFPYKSLWLNHRIKHELKLYDIIILSSTIFNNKIIRYIENSSRENSRLILWFWNPIGKVGNPNVSSRWEKVSFDMIEAKKFKIDFNNTYYFKDFTSTESSPTIRKKIGNRVFFLGQDKGRLLELLRLRDSLKKYGLELDLYIVKDKTSIKSDYNYKPRLSYDKVIVELLKYNILLDFNQDGQSGLTLRIMESLFFQKKVITNNNFVKMYDFYNPSNIFILDEDPIDSLKDFLDISYEKISDEIMMKYDFPNWLDRLINEK